MKYSLDDQDLGNRTSSLNWDHMKGPESVTAAYGSEVSPTGIVLSQQ